jgi:hypothetical protein
MRNATMMMWTLIISLSVVSCSKSENPGKVGNTPPPAPATSATNEAPTPTAAPAPTSTETQPEDSGVKTEMRDVRFHLTRVAAAHLIVVSGALWPTGKNNLVDFDDKTSFEMRVANGTMSISPDALADIMNNYVFAKADAPLKGLTVAIDGGRLIIKGKLHSKGDISFGTEGTLSLNSDGRIRVQTEKITALKVPVKGLMGLFGLELASVVNTSKIDGIDTDKNDLLMDLGKVLPPPHIRGKLTAVTVSKDRIVTTFGDGGRSLPEPKEQGSYMAFSGSRVKFGKLLMDPTDLTVLDVDPKSTLEWDQDRYKEQLQEGYSKITASFGLRAYAKDFSKLGRNPGAGQQEPAGK